MSNSVSTQIENVEIEDNDILFFKNTDSKNGEIVDYLCQANQNQTMSCVSNTIKLKKKLKFLFMFNNLRNITPSTLSQSKLIFLDSTSVEDSYLTESILLELNWDVNWTNLIKSQLEKIEQDFLSQLIIYLKYLDSSNSLIIWFGEKQLIYSLK